jgi:hypothetical protein
MEENSNGLIQILFQHFPRGTEKPAKFHDSWCPSWDLNQAPLKYKSRALQLEHVQSFTTHDLIITNREMLRVRVERHSWSSLRSEWHLYYGTAKLMKHFIQDNQ